MSEFSTNAWLQGILESEARLAMPVTTSLGMELIGRPLGQLFTDGKTQADSVVALARKYPSIAALTQMDLSVEAEAFGAEVKFGEGEAPTITAGVVSDLASVEALAVPRVGAGRTFEYVRAASLAGGQITDRPTFGGMIGPFSLGCRLMDMSELMSATRRNPELVHTLLEKCTEFLVAYAQAFKDAGANGVLIAEPAAGLMSPAFCQTFSSD
jgi:uroporphyrinogen decarboxylase